MVYEAVCAKSAGMNDFWKVKGLSQGGQIITDMNDLRLPYNEIIIVDKISPQLRMAIDRGDVELVAEPMKLIQQKERELIEREQRDRLFELEKERKQKEIELIITQNEKLRQEIRAKGTGSQVKGTPSSKSKADKPDDFFPAPKGTRWSNVRFININHTKIKILIGDSSKDFFFEDFYKKVLPKYLTSLLKPV